MQRDEGSSSSRTLSAGDILGSWVVEACVSPGTPRLYAAHRHDDEGARALVTTLPLGGATGDRMSREASILRELSHPALPDLIDHGTSREHDVAWMATADLGCDTLQDRLLMGPLPWREACAVFEQLGEGLKHAHDHGVVHRDVHPGKILLCVDGKAQLCGFEVASRADDAVGAPLGPVGYLAPEVITAGAAVGPRADLYALGVTLFEALTGRSAFPAALMDDRVDPSDRMLEWKTRAAPLRPDGDVPGWLGSLVAKATHPDPAERLPDLDAFVSWLDAARGLWDLDEAPEPARSVPVDAPPPLRPVRPSLVPSASRAALPALAPEPDPSPWLAAATMNAAGLGVVVGLVFSLVVIVMSELAHLG